MRVGEILAIEIMRALTSEQPPVAVTSAARSRSCAPAASGPTEAGYPAATSS